MPKKGSSKAVKALTKKPEYMMAAVRYQDGGREIFRIKNPDSLADARAMIYDQLSNVHSVLIALDSTDFVGEW